VGNRAHNEGDIKKLAKVCIWCSIVYISVERQRARAWELASEGKVTLFARYKHVCVHCVCVCVTFLSHLTYPGLDELQRDA